MLGSTNDISNTIGNNGSGHLVTIDAGAMPLEGILSVPPEAKGLVILIQGIADLPHSSQQNTITCAQAFMQRKLATLIVDLFTSEERKLDQQTEFFRRNTEIMQQRITGIADWHYANPQTENYMLGYFGSGVSGAAALLAAAERPDVVAAVVSVEGRVDLAQDALARVMAPTLLLAGENDELAIQQNREALKLLPARKQFESIQGSASLFEDRRSLDEVIRLAGEWFDRWLMPIV